MCNACRHNRAAADTRAKGLLLRHLTRKQRTQLLLLRRFDVTSQSGRSYCISAKDTFNVVSDGQRFCVQFDDRRRAHMSIYDQLLMQKLVLENDEPLFIAYANTRPSIRKPELATQLARVALWIVCWVLIVNCIGAILGEACLVLLRLLHVLP